MTHTTDVCEIVAANPNRTACATVPRMATMNAAGEDRAPNMAQIRQVQFGDDGTAEFVVVEDFFELPDTRPPAE